MSVRISANAIFFSWGVQKPLVMVNALRKMSMNRSENTVAAVCPKIVPDSKMAKNIALYFFSMFNKSQQTETKKKSPRSADQCPQKKANRASRMVKI